eukprot:CAMPEP_0114623764 /NCGR_PEP_ID=MMETSP0168-20121206/10421_1 /TAXON_ID=95228 ORGANISM="Vannella sp., Strain DIVA3 517/6/12" /NCGR_SAMPLE_ID=MMETSP0168 /ASSEMBLY_ACC=CAM_ASM_000044 /LENGTH=578 /DNA_ID=CAMNT_0001835021 /DNA_START=45 /DNA_END=1778 /DNA_ORIENTATION=+
MQAGSLRITVLSGKNLTPKKKDTSSPFVVLGLIDKSGKVRKEAKTRPQKNTLNPEWQGPSNWVSFQVDKNFVGVKGTVYHHVSKGMVSSTVTGSKHKFMGEFTIGMQQVRLAQQAVVKTFSLSARKGKEEEVRGSITVEIHFTPAADDAEKPKLPRTASEPLVAPEVADPKSELYKEKEKLLTKEEKKVKKALVKQFDLPPREYLNVWMQCPAEMMVAGEWVKGAMYVTKSYLCFIGNKSKHAAIVKHKEISAATPDSFSNTLTIKTFSKITEFQLEKDRRDNVLELIDNQKSRRDSRIQPAQAPPTFYEQFDSSAPEKPEEDDDSSSSSSESEKDSEKEDSGKEDSGKEEENSGKEDKKEEEEEVKVREKKSKKRSHRRRSHKHDEEEGSEKKSHSKHKHKKDKKRHSKNRESSKDEEEHDTEKEAAGGGPADAASAVAADEAIAVLDALALEADGEDEEAAYRDLAAAAAEVEAEEEADATRAAEEDMAAEVARAAAQEIADEKAAKEVADKAAAEKEAKEKAAAEKEAAEKEAAAAKAAQEEAEKAAAEKAATEKAAAEKEAAEKDAAEKAAAEK